MKNSILSSASINCSEILKTCTNFKILLSICAFLFAQVLLIANVNPPIITSLNLQKSTVSWTGRKVTGQHTGTIAIQGGNLSFADDGTLSGGQFELDMNSITCTDLGGGSASQLESHLKSDDFFGVAAFPTATLNITNISNTGSGTYDVVADVMIKGITQPVRFKTTINDNQAIASIVIDRSKFNVRYGSGSFFQNLGDKAIYDEFTLEVKLSME